MILVYYNLDPVFIFLAIVSSFDIVLSKMQRPGNSAASLKRNQTGQKNRSCQAIRRVSQLYMEKKTKVNFFTQTVCCKHPSQFTDQLPGSTLSYYTYCFPVQ